MSIDLAQDLLNRLDVSRDDLARRMFITADELEALLSEKVRFKRLHSAGLERATLSLALERRDPSLVSQPFRWQMLRYAMLILQEHRPGNAEQDSNGHTSS